MEEGVAGPEIKTIKEHKFMAKEKKNHQKTPTKINSGKLCCLTEKKNC